MFKIILMWFLFIPIPIINGFLRESWYKKKVGELGANIVGFFVLSSIFLVYTYLFFKNQISNFHNNEIFLIGSLWLVMTLIFEFGIGLITGRSWKYMLADYNVLKGRLWPLNLIIIFLAPFIIKLIVIF
jgi:hypothetical protein